jgi:hypothetical protein
LILILLFARQFHKPNVRSPKSGSIDLLSKAQLDAFERQQTISSNFLRSLKLLTPLMFSTTVNPYTFLVSTSLSPFNCVSHFNELTGTSIYIIARNSSKLCYDDEWYPELPFAYIFSILYGLLFPSVVAVTFFRHRKNTDDVDFQRGYSGMEAIYTPYTTSNLNLLSST